MVVIGGIFLFSLLFSPNQGVLARIYQRVRLSLQVAQDHILLALVRREEKEAGRAGLRPAELMDNRGRLESRWRNWRLAICGGGNCWYRRMAWSNCLPRANKPRCACCAITGFGRPI